MIYDFLFIILRPNLFSEIFGWQNNKFFEIQKYSSKYLKELK